MITLRISDPLLTLFVALIVGGCGGNTESDDAGPLGDATTDTSIAPMDGGVDTSTDAISPSDASDGGPASDGGCTYVDAGAPYVIVYDVPSAQLDPVGGAIEVGLYYAQTITVYTGDGGPSGLDPIWSTPIAFALALGSDGGAERIDSSGTISNTFTWSASGTTLTLEFVMQQCSYEPGTGQTAYSVNDGGLVLIPLSPTSFPNFTAVFTKQ